MLETEELRPAPVSDRRLQGKVGVITGASSGIGEAAARELARLGAHVVLAARRFHALERIARDIEAAGGTAHPFIMYSTKPENLKRMVQTAADRYGRLDYAVNNAGIGDHGAFLDTRVEDFDRIMETNVGGVFLAMQAEIAALRESGGGASVNSASVRGIAGAPGISGYVASKHAVVGQTKSTALKYATQNIRVNTIAPGATETEIYAQVSLEFKNQLASYPAMKRLAEPIEIARGIVYRLADATFSTNIVLSADAGQSGS